MGSLGRAAWMCDIEPLPTCMAMGLRSLPALQVAGGGRGQAGVPPRARAVEDAAVTKPKALPCQCWHGRALAPLSICITAGMGVGRLGFRQA